MDRMRSVRACAMPGLGTVMAAHGMAAAAAAGTSSGAVRHKVDGRAVDQAVAYVLMAAALAVTYLVH
ncbi:hypothetical protein ACP70R_041377 [Stipagrostis hirtigluma subsp. patula]